MYFYKLEVYWDCLVKGPVQSVKLVYHFHKQLLAMFYNGWYQQSQRRKLKELHVNQVQAQHVKKHDTSSSHMKEMKPVYKLYLPSS